MSIFTIVRKLSGLRWLIAAIVVVLLFVIAHVFGLRENTNVLSGTVIYQPEQLFYAVLYVGLYGGVVVLVPILLIAFVVTNSLTLAKTIKKSAIKHSA